MTEVDLDVEHTGGRGRNELFVETDGQLFGAQSVPMDILYVAEGEPKGDLVVGIMVRALNDVVATLGAQATVRGTHLSALSSNVIVPPTNAQQVIIALKPGVMSVVDLVTQVRKASASALLIVVDSARTEASEADESKNVFITNTNDLTETLRTVLGGAK